VIRLSWSERIDIAILYDPPALVLPTAITAAWMNTKFKRIQNSISDEIDHFQHLQNV
jgi:hypothetical protein